MNCCAAQNWHIRPVVVIFLADQISFFFNYLNLTLTFTCWSLFLGNIKLLTTATQFSPFILCLLFQSIFPVPASLLDMFLGEPAVARENNCLNAAKACNLNDTCKKYRSAYISPCTSRVSTAEVCNKRKCHKALRQFFDKARHFWHELIKKRREKKTRLKSTHTHTGGFPNDWYLIKAECPPQKDLLQKEEPYWSG